MDNNTLLKNVITSLINEDETTANEAFKQYTTAKVRSLVEEDNLIKKKAKNKKESDENTSDEDEDSESSEDTSKK